MWFHKRPSRVEEGRNRIDKRPGRTQKTKMSGRIPARGSTWAPPPPPPMIPMLPGWCVRSCLPPVKPCEPCPQCLTQSPTSPANLCPLFFPPFSKHHASLSPPPPPPHQRIHPAIRSAKTSTWVPTDPSSMPTTPPWVSSVSCEQVAGACVCTCAGTRARVDCKSVGRRVPWSQTRAFSPPHPFTRATNRQFSQRAKRLVD